VIVGCVSHDWGRYGRDPLSVASWFILLQQFFEQSKTKVESRGKGGETKVTYSDGPQTAIIHAISSQSWLGQLFTAATSLVESKDKDRERYLRLFRLGLRKAGFLGRTCQRVPIFLVFWIPQNF
jgi:hypothetical protein